jgi:murein DD-endopeptidase MepM/ murein hydrolase activator NlpD
VRTVNVELRRRRCNSACLAAMLAGTAIVGTVVLRGPSSAPTGPDAPKPPPVAGPAAGGAPPTAAEVAPGGAAGDAAATPPPVARVGGAGFTVGASLRADATVHRADPEAPRGAGADAVETSAPTPPPLPARRRIDLEVSAGDTLIGMLLRLGIGRAEAHAAVEGLRDVYDPRRLRPGQHLEVQTDAAARRLVRLAFAPSERERIELVRADGGFEAERRARPTVTEERLVEAEVRTSLHAAATTAGVPAVVLAEVLRIFSWDVDYQREMRPGDEIAVLFDRERIPGGPVVGAGDVRYARLQVGDRVLEAFRFERDGEALFFDRDGKSRRKFLLRTPVSGARLSSGFGMRRHPILGYTRMHQGVDFAAPTGTPILAAGDGRLVRVGRYGSYGNYVRIAHGDVYATAYAHLAGFADGVRAGHRVEQGEVIGYVGSTGRSTGPHLHFEVLEHGEPVDPLGIARSPAEHLAGDALAAFHREIRAVETRLAALGNRTFASERAPGGASGG